MQDRFKFRYVFEKDFGGNTGLCYKMPVFDLDETVRTEFEKIIKGYTDYNYKLVSKDQCTGLKDKNGTLIYEGDVLKINTHFNLLVPDDFEYKYESEKGYSLFKVYYNEEFARYEMKRIKWVKWETEHKRLCNIHTNHIIIGNIYENR